MECQVLRRWAFGQVYSFNICLQFRRNARVFERELQEQQEMLERKAQEMKERERHAAERRERERSALIFRTICKF